MYYKTEDNIFQSTLFKHLRIFRNNIYNLIVTIEIRSKQEGFIYIKSKRIDPAVMQRESTGTTQLRNVRQCWDGNGPHLMG
jgi:hypothetical protein